MTPVLGGRGRTGKREPVGVVRADYIILLPLPKLSTLILEGVAAARRTRA